MWFERCCRIVRAMYFFSRIAVVHRRPQCFVVLPKSAIFEHRKMSIRELALCIVEPCCDLFMGPGPQHSTSIIVQICWFTRDDAHDSLHLLNSFRQYVFRWGDKNLSCKFSIYIVLLFFVRCISQCIKWICKAVRCWLNMTSSGMD